MHGLRRLTPHLKSLIIFLLIGWSLGCAAFQKGPSSFSVKTVNYTDQFVFAYLTVNSENFWAGGTTAGDTEEARKLGVGRNSGVAIFQPLLKTEKVFIEFPSKELVYMAEAKLPEFKIPENAIGTGYNLLIHIYPENYVQLEYQTQVGNWEDGISYYSSLGEISQATLRQNPY